jgi:glucose-6-phosphate 1-epimerase
VDGENGLAKVTMRSRDGATAEVYLHGAHLTSWRPARGGDEQLFVSARSEFRDGVAIRGGIPVIFPQFASEGPLPKHGFARTSAWALASSGEDADGNAVASFVLEDSEATRAIWPAAFRLTLGVTVGGARLDVALSAENTGSGDLAFTAALHTYLRVADAARAELVGLRGGRYRTSPAEFHVDDGESIHFDRAIDRVYVHAPAHLTLAEQTREVALDRANFPDVVVWNPGAAAAAELKDMEPDGERRMVCVEAAVVQTPVSLAPRQRWWGSQTFTARSRATEHLERGMSAEEESPNSDPRVGLTAQLRQLEEFVARTEQSGEELPPEAAEMVARLREIMLALEGLTSTFGDADGAPR